MKSINGRIKELRNDAGLNQKEFSELLGMTQSGVSYMEQDGRNVSDITIKSICNHLSVSEEWLRYGKEPKYIKPDSFSLDRFVKDRGMTDFELEIVKAYFELDPGIRTAVVSHFRNRLIACTAEPEDLWSDCPDTPEELERQFPPVPNKNKGVG